MSCRSRPSSSAALSLVRQQLRNRFGVDVSDQFLQHAYHTMKRDNAAEAPPTSAEWEEFLADQRASVRRLAADGGMTATRAERILDRLANAETETPTGAEWAAMRHLKSNSTMALERRIHLARSLAEPLGLKTEAFLAKFDGYTADYEAAAAQNNLGSLPHVPVHPLTSAAMVDAASGYAAAAIQRDLSTKLTDVARTRPQRITRTPIPESEQHGESPAIESGFDPTSGRLELLRRTPTGETALDVYCGLPADLGAEVAANPNDPAATDRLNDLLAAGISPTGNRYRYGTALSEATAGVRPRCGNCGRFTNETLTCAGCPGGVKSDPMTQLHAYQLTAPGVVADLPRRSNVIGEAARLDVNEIVVPYSMTSISPDRNLDPYVDMPGDKNARVKGDLVLRVDEDRRIAITQDSLQCSCSEYVRTLDCRHVAMGRNLAAEHFQPGIGPVAPLSAADLQAYQSHVAALAQQIRDADVSLNPELNRITTERLAAATEPLFTGENGEAEWNSAVQDAQGAMARGDDLFTYETKNVIDSAHGGDRRTFGVEIEFTFPDHWEVADIDRATEKIGSELRDSNFTRIADPLSHGTARDLAARASDGVGYSTSHEGGWTLETEPSILVGGSRRTGLELISPIMRDNPETWATLQRVTDIISQHGGTITPECGFHVHVGSNVLADSGPGITSLLRLTADHEDTFYRTFSNPGQGADADSDRAHRHRGNMFTVPVRLPREGMRTLDPELQDSGKQYPLRDSVVNITHLRGNNPRAEIRGGDGTLHAPTMQQRIKTAVAMVAYAERSPDETIRDNDYRENVGYRHHAARDAEAAQALTGHADVLPSPDETNLSPRALADVLFTRDTDRRSFAAMWAATTDPDFNASELVYRHDPTARLNY